MRKKQKTTPKKEREGEPWKVDDNDETVSECLEPSTAQLQPHSSPWGGQAEALEASRSQEALVRKPGNSVLGTSPRPSQPSSPVTDFGERVIPSKSTDPSGRSRTQPPVGSCTAKMVLVQFTRTKRTDLSDICNGYFSLRSKRLTTFDPLKQNTCYLTASVGQNPSRGLADWVKLGIFHDVVWASSGAGGLIQAHVPSK